VRSRASLTGALLAGLVLVVALLVVFLQPPAVAPPGPTGRPAGATTDPDSGLRVVSLAALPVEARDTVARIDRGGPFRYAKDGAVFGNRERLLPARPNGFYREYTVPTPGEDDRGARRIVTGDDQLFYTADHYASFVLVRR
jgi:ribonuclease T1